MAADMQRVIRVEYKGLTIQPKAQAQLCKASLATDILKVFVAEAAGAGQC